MKTIQKQNLFDIGSIKLVHRLVGVRENVGDERIGIYIPKKLRNVAVCFHFHKEEYLPLLSLPLKLVCVWLPV